MNWESLLGGIMGSLCLLIGNLFADRSRDRRRKATLAAAAEEAKAKLHAEAENTARQVKAKASREASEEWQRIASYHSDRCEMLDRKIDSMEQKHTECEVRCERLERRLRSVEGTVTEIKNHNHNNHNP